MTDQKYEGWTNRETWLVSLWLNNEQSLQEQAQTVCQADNAMLQEAAEGLREWMDDVIEDATDLSRRSGLVRDLVTAALDRVNWPEVAEQFREPA